MDLPEPHDRLSSWKAIAAFLDRNVRTVQRWEKDFGLPLRRGGPRERGAVVASKREVSEWWERRRTTLSDGGPLNQSESPGQVGAPGADNASRSRAPVAAWLVAAGLVALTAAPAMPPVDATARIPQRTGRLLATSTSEGSEVSPAALIPLNASAHSLTLSPTGLVAYVSLHEERAVVLVDLVARKIADRIELPEPPARLTLSLDGSRLFVAGKAADLAVIDLRRRTVVPYPVGGLVHSLRVAPDGQHVWLAMAQEGLKILDVRTGRVEDISTIGCPIYLASARQSRRIFLSYQCGGPGGHWGHDAIEIIDEVTRRPLLARAGPPLVGDAMAVSPDEQQLWAATADACSNANREYDEVGCPPGRGPVLHAFRTDPFELLRTIRIPATTSDALPVFFPDGSRLVVLGSGLNVIDRSLGTVYESIDGDHREGAFTADGRRFVSISPSGRALIEFDTTAAPDAEVFRGTATHWSGDGTANDVVGGTHALTTDGVRFEPGRYGQAFSFDGTGPGANFGRRMDPSLAVDPGSYAAWIKVRRLGARLTIASRTTSMGWSWSVTRAGRLSFCVGHAVADLSCESGGFEGRSSVQLDKWHHVAVVRSATGLTMYFDGREDGATPVATGFASQDSAVSNQAVLRLGAGAAGSDPFHGLIDEVTLFRRALSASDVAQVMRATWIEEQLVSRTR